VGPRRSSDKSRYHNHPPFFSPSLLGLPNTRNMHAMQCYLLSTQSLVVTSPLTLDLVDGLGQAPNVLAGDAGNRDAAVLGRVHRVLSESV
jgi:hypothetical protein